MKNLEFRKVDRDTPLAAALVEFVTNFSWEEVKAHTLQEELSVSVLKFVPAISL